jgi:succinylglutamate desuccinylase
MKVLLNTFTHGNERIGEKVSAEIRATYSSLIGKGLDIQIANEEAYRQNKRFIEVDLNRAFPGNTEGSYEERRAYQIASHINEYAIVIDVHSTESGSGDMVIVTKMDAPTRALLAYLSPKYVLFMNFSSSANLISYANIGIALEMGADSDRATFQKTMQGIERILSYAKLIDETPPLSDQSQYFEVFTQIEKPKGARLLAHVSNFILIKKGEVFARTIDGAGIIAQFDFYPVIFGSDNYETIFGFGARQLPA